MGSYGMWKLLTFSWLVTLVIADKGSPKAHGCQLLPVFKTFPSKYYPNKCSLTVPAFLCAGFCESKADPFKAVQREDHKDVWEIKFREDCECCSPPVNMVKVAVIENWNLQCTDGVPRNETVHLQMSTKCSCSQCRASLPLFN